MWAPLGEKTTSESKDSSVYVGGVQADATRSYACTLETEESLDKTRHWYCRGSKSTKNRRKYSNLAEKSKKWQIFLSFLHPWSP